MGLSRRQWSGFALAFGICGTAFGQAPQIPASDAVGVGRAGAGVAYGRSLEATSLNPALLPTLQDHFSAYFAAGFELQESQATLQSNQTTFETTDRNRLLAGFGLGWKLSDQMGFGLKLDQPWEHHGLLPDDATGRFLGREWDLDSRRLEAQFGYEFASHPGLSIGLGVGMTRVSFTGSNTVRALVDQNGDQPTSGANPAIGLAEQSLTESASAVRPSFTLGARWAINPRWTLAAAYQSQVSGTMSLSSGFLGGASYVGLNGFAPTQVGTDAQGQAMLAASTTHPGTGDFKLPAKATLGVRNRVNNLFTWEFDLREIQGGLQMPTWANLQTPNGLVTAPSQLSKTKRGTGFSTFGEFDITANFTLRGGIAYDPAMLADAQVTPAFGGQSSTTFSIGATYRAWGGDWSVGYAYRQAKDAVVPQGVDGVWNRGGYAPSDTPARVESMGHLISLGYKVAF